MNCSGFSGTGALGKFEHKLSERYRNYEVYPLAQVNEAYGRMLSGKARFRVVLKQASSGTGRDDYAENTMSELAFEVVQESDGGYCAECLTENIFTQADSWDELRRNVIEAVSAFFFDRPAPRSVRLHLVRDEVFSVT